MQSTFLKTCLLAAVLFAPGRGGLGAYEYDGSADQDIDGFTDAEEYIADTQPTNAASFFP